MDTKLNRLSYNTNLDASIVRLLQSRTVAATIKMFYLKQDITSLQETTHKNTLTLV